MLTLIANGVDIWYRTIGSSFINIFLCQFIALPTSKNPLKEMWRGPVLFLWVEEEK